MRKRKVNIPLKPLFFVLAVFIFLIFISGYILQLLTTADYFKVKDVAGGEGLNAEPLYLKGKNIFLLNLARESLYIARFCPDCLKVKVARILPDRIFVEFVKRRPVALVKLYRYFAVDQNGVFFNISQEPKDLKLPVITGLETKISAINPGEVSKVKELSLAISIIKETDKFRNLRDYPIQRIDVSGLDNITILIPVYPDNLTYNNWLPPGRQKILEVKISEGNIVERIAVMSGLINQERNNLANIKYIDLRFKEPVIKFQDVVK